MSCADVLDVAYTSTSFLLLLPSTLGVPAISVASPDSGTTPLIPPPCAVPRAAKMTLYRDLPARLRHTLQNTTLATDVLLALHLAHLYLLRLGVGTAGTQHMAEFPRGHVLGARVAKQGATTERVGLGLAPGTGGEGLAPKPAGEDKARGEGALHKPEAARRVIEAGGVVAGCCVAL